MLSTELRKYLFGIFLVLSLSQCAEPEQGPAGLVSLVNIVPEAPGNNCTTGGFKVHTGVDEDRDTVLDAEEVQNAVFICNGANGQDGVNGTDGTNGSNGTDGFNSLIKVTSEPKGANCPDAGYKIETGIDDNRDGVLSSDEVESTIYICLSSLVNYGKHTIVLTGDITNQEAADLIASDLGTATQEVKIVACTNLTSVDLSGLVSAIDIRISGNKELKTINLSGLQFMNGGFLVSYCPMLEVLNLESLQSVTCINDFQFEERFDINNSGLPALSLPSLTKIQGSGYFTIHENLQLTSISIPSLKTSTGSIQLHCSNVENIDLGQLIEANNLQMSSQKVSTLSLPELLELNELGIQFTGNTFTSLSLPKLTKGILNIFGSSLTNLTLPVFLEGRISVSQNNLLTQLNLPLVETLNLNVESKALTSLLLPKLTKGNIDIGLTSLASLQIPELTEGDVYIERYYINGMSGQSVLSSVNLPKLIKGNVEIGGYYDTGASYIPAEILSSLSMPEFVNGSVLLTGSSITSLALPKLEVGSIYVTPAVASTHVLNQLLVPALKKGSLSLKSTSLTSLSFPSLSDTTYMLVETNLSLTEIQMPLLPKLNSIRIMGNLNLTTISIPLNFIRSSTEQSTLLENNSFSSTYINSFLSTFAQVTPVLMGSTIRLRQNPPAPPTGQGLTDYNTLVANGNYVEVDF